jgi:hypothetical protein
MKVTSNIPKVESTFTITLNLREAELLTNLLGEMPTSDAVKYINENLEIPRYGDITSTTYDEAGTFINDLYTHLSNELPAVKN